MAGGGQFQWSMRLGLFQTIAVTTEKTRMWPRVTIINQQDIEGLKSYMCARR